MTLPKNVFTLAHPLARHKLTLLRSVATEPKKFREVVSELATMLVYEATRDLPLRALDVQTPLTTARGAEMAEKIGLIPILRAGL
ncbi:MAG: uracil phosphoribosyltransferase, partial [Caldilineaceae bacterium]|nr:uracil phosphoribosyltransferase [Caldilineaceae bacterium]